jgi:hypothetical protein
MQADSSTKTASGVAVTIVVGEADGVGSPTTDTTLGVTTNEIEPVVDGDDWQAIETERIMASPNTNVIIDFICFLQRNMS